MTLTSILVGFGVSIFTEIVTYINKGITGSVFSGKGAWLLAAGLALFAGIIDYFLKGNNGFQIFLSQTAIVYASSETFFNTIITTFNLNVQ